MGGAGATAGDGVLASTGEVDGHLEARYACEHLRADTAAASSQVDELIEPGQTRAALVQALGSIDENRLTTRDKVR